MAALKLCFVRFLILYDPCTRCLACLIGAGRHTWKRFVVGRSSLGSFLASSETVRRAPGLEGHRLASGRLLFCVSILNHSGWESELLRRRSAFLGGQVDLFGSMPKLRWKARRERSTLVRRARGRGDELGYAAPERWWYVAASWNLGSCGLSLPVAVQGQLASTYLARPHPLCRPRYG